MVGSAAQTYTMASNAYIPSLVVAKDNLADTVSPTAGSYLNVGKISVTQGTLTLSAVNTILGLVGSSTALTLAAGAGNGDILHNSGTLTLNPSSAVNNTSIGSINVNGRGLTLNHLVVDVRGGSAATRPYFTLQNTDLITVLGNFTIDSGMLWQSAAAPATEQLEIYGNVAFNCPNIFSDICSYHTGTGAGAIANGVRAKLVGGSKTITQHANAGFGFRRLEIDLDNSGDTLTLLSNIHSEKTNLSGAGPWSDIYVTQGTVDSSTFVWSNILNLDVGATGTCTSPLMYSTSSGVTGSGCGP
jgi:hypothetical protein